MCLQFSLSCIRNYKHWKKLLIDYLFSKRTFPTTVHWLRSSVLHHLHHFLDIFPIILLSLNGNKVLFLLLGVYDSSVSLLSPLEMCLSVLPVRPKKPLPGGICLLIFPPSILKSINAPAVAAKSDPKQTRRKHRPKANINNENGKETTWRSRWKH